MSEDDTFVASKTKCAIDHGLSVIFCCGESLDEREKGVTVDVVTRQLEAVNKVVDKGAWKSIVIAYEPIWAIGTGKVATTGKHTHLLQHTLQKKGKRRKTRIPHQKSLWIANFKRAPRTIDQAQEVHAAIRSWLSSSIDPQTAENTRIIYGGSVTETNCRDLAKQTDIDGFLVGGASLKPAFVDIVNSNQ